MFWGSLLRAVTSIGQHVQREEWISLHLWGGGCSLAWLLVRQVEVCLSLGRQSTALGRKAYISCRAGVQLCAECPFCDASLGVYSTNRQVLNSFTDTQEWVGQLTSCATLANQRLVNPGALYTLGTVSAAEQRSGISAPRAGCHTAPLSAFPIREEAPELNHPCCGTGQPGTDPKSPSASRKGKQKGCSDFLPTESLTWSKSLKLWKIGHLHGAGNTGRSHAGVARGNFRTAHSLLPLALWTPVCIGALCNSACSAVCWLGLLRV